jgi:hypothetical protein
MNQYNTPPVYFDIVFTEQVVFKDLKGNITHQFEIGDTIKASHDTGIYYVTAVGGIYHSEAKKV